MDNISALSVFLGSEENGGSGVMLRGPLPLLSTRLCAQLSCQADIAGHDVCPVPGKVGCNAAQLTLLGIQCSVQRGDAGLEGVGWVGTPGMQ